MLEMAHSLVLWEVGTTYLAKSTFGIHFGFPSCWLKFCPAAHFSQGLFGGCCPGAKSIWPVVRRTNDLCHGRCMHWACKWWEKCGDRTMVCFSFGYGWLWLKLIPNWDAMKPKKLVMFSLQPSNLLGTRVWMDTFLDKGKTNGKGRTFSTCLNAVDVLRFNFKRISRYKSPG